MSVSAAEAEKRHREALPSSLIPTLKSKTARHAVHKESLDNFMATLSPDLQEALRNQGEHGVLVIARDRVNSGGGLLTIEVLGPK